MLSVCTLVDVSENHVSLRRQTPDQRGKRFSVSRARRIMGEEVRFLQPVLLLASGIAKLIPPFVGARFRVRLLRAAGIAVGNATLCDVPTMYGAGNIRQKLSIGSGVFINVGCTFDLSDRIVIGDDVSLGHEVLILTSTHAVGTHGRRAAHLSHGAVTIGRGAWIGARAVILPGVTIGSGAVVAAGAVVIADLPSHSMSAGVPAKVKAELDRPPPFQP
jgi:maltose O-acetyltransferase